MTQGPLRKFLASTVGSKVLVGLSGLLLLGFLVVHLAENALLLIGPEAFNSYVHLLTSNPLILPAELALLALFLLHVTQAIRVTLRNRRARPVAYQQKAMAGPPSRKSWASSSMIWTGLLVLVFLIIHLRNFKWGTEYAVAGSDQRDLHRTVVEFFQAPLNVAFYVLAMVVVGIHLRHGFASGLQSLGIDHPAWTPRLLWLGKLTALLIAGGFAALTLILYLRHGGQP